jgi:hypothetical protein
MVAEGEEEFIPVICTVNRRAVKKIEKIVS